MTYLARTVPNIEDLLKPLEDAIRQLLLPSITGQNALSDDERDLMALPARLGGLGIADPSRQATGHFSSSEKITAPLATLILLQSPEYPPEAKAEQVRAKSTARNLRRQHEGMAAEELKERLPDKMQRAMTVASEKGASSWLLTMPIADHGFDLHKGAFRDALCLRYGWRPHLLPSHCVCSQRLSIEHALSCSRGGFPSIRHNEIRDLTADLMTEVCYGVGTEPGLQPVTKEQLTHKSANTEDGARLDIVAENFWGRDRQRAFFDVRVFNPFAQSHCNSPLAQCYRKQELEKKRVYEERVREVEHGTFSPLVFTTAGGLGPTATVVYKRLASHIAEKHDRAYGKTLHLIRCRLNFSLLRSAIMCLRGSRSATHRPASPLSGDIIDLSSAEGRVPNED